MKKLVILESPNKIIKVKTFLSSIDKDNDYIVKASIGHFRLIPNTGIENLGINLNEMRPDWEIDSKKINIVKNLIEEAKKADQIILATDPDREGEAIAWHLYEILKPYNKNFKRMKLNSITKDCIKKEINNLGEIDINYVNSALSRQMIDRIFGYLLSKSVRENVGGLSAGRVQSASLRILSDRQRELNNYKEKFTYYLQDNINGFIFKNYLMSNDFKPTYINKYEKIEDVEILKNNADSKYKILNIIKSDFKDKKLLPFSTVDLYKTASSILKYKIDFIKDCAQFLFEQGWITYIRTDSNKIDEETENDLISYAIKKYGNDKIGTIKQKESKDSDQEGHPAITPTHFEWDLDYLLTDEGLKNIEKDNLKKEHIELYKLIWSHTISCILKEPSGEKFTYILENQSNKQTLYFVADFKIYTFNGYYDQNIFLNKSDDSEIYKKFNNFKINDFINVNKLEIIKEKNSPPSKYNEISLIEALQKYEIGRPSTYKTAVSINIERGYVDLEKDKKSSMTVNSEGISVDEYLSKYFSEIVNLNYTKQMEKDLDLIAQGKIDNYILYLKDFYKNIKSLCSKTSQNINSNICDKCGSVMIIRKYKNNKFYGCSNYPNCKNTINILNEKEKQNKCDKCENGYLIKRKSNKGNFFYGCSNYPNCNNVKNI